MSALDGIDTLSVRGRRLVDSPPLAEYLIEHFKRRDQPYDAALRPSGYVPLCVAENKLVGDLLRERLDAPGALPPSALGYDAMIGSRAFRQVLARFMAERFLGRRFEADNLALLAGAGSVLEILSYVIADPGDAVLVPTPSYAGFWPDLQTRDALEIVPVVTSSRDGFRLHVELLERARASATRPVRALLFTSPDNPLGRVYTREEIAAVVAWAERANVHLIIDEIYALSVFGERAFVSAASVVPSLGERVHIVWAFSKDFALSGARVGALVSENPAVLQAVDALAYWSACSGPTQHVLSRMLADDAWVTRYLGENRARLAQAYRAVTSALDGAGIAHLESSAGFFMLLDLRRFLGAPSWDAERALWRRLLQEANVNLTPGAACRIGEPGFMRLCFAGVPTETAVHAVHALARVLRSGHS